jgi:transposase
VADPEPVWHQFAELPPVSAVVTEFQGHARTCPCCGHLTRESIPAEIRAHAFGPRLAAALSYLSGSQYVSQRGLEDVCEVVFGVPLSLGSFTALQEQMGRALEPAHREIAAEVRPAPFKNVDETGWKQAGVAAPPDTLGPEQVQLAELDLSWCRSASGTYTDQLQ